MYYLISEMSTLNCCKESARSQNLLSGIVDLEIILFSLVPDGLSILDNPRKILDTLEEVLRDRFVYIETA